MSRWTTVPTLAVGVAVVAGLTLFTPDPWTEHRVSWSEGERGTDVSAPRLTVRVDEPGFARELLVGFDEEVLRTEEVFVAVPLEIDIRQQQSVPKLALYTDDGRYYDARSEAFAAPDTTPPGFTAVATSLFLVPAEELPGARLRVTAASREPTNHAVGVSVDLLITDAAEVRAEADAAAPLELPGSEVVVT